MKLKTVQIENFKCIRDSTDFGIDEKVTCLVGKNESGKTATLQAITKLNPTDTTKADFDELEFPRHQLNEYQESANYADSLTTTWELEEKELKILRELIGLSANSLGVFKVTKGYSNKLEIELENFDEGLIVKHILEQSSLMKDEKSTFDIIANVKDLQETLENLADPTQRQKEFLENLTDNFTKGTALQTVVNFMQRNLPKVAYFNQYMKMAGQISVQDIKTRQSNETLEDEHKVFLALLTMIGRDISALEKIQEHERLIADLEGASNRLTREIFNYWTQNRHLKVQFKFDQALPNDPAPFNSGWILRTRIENTRHGVTTGFDQRSAGFVWFFSFLVWFSQIKKQYGDNLIILLDEPGLSLHAKAQADLLRYIEERLAPKYQVIYTTHSPFMIDPKNLLRARTVEDVFIESKNNNDLLSDGEDLGTKVGDRVLSKDRDTVFPLQACLGYEITQTLFIGEHTLLVEGPSEILYIEWFKRKLSNEKRTTLDKRWTICPCGGIDKIPAFLSLFAGNSLNIAVLTDFADGQKRRIKDLKESKLLLDGRVLTADMYANQQEADIEDLLGRETYIELVKQTYKLNSKQNLPNKKPKDASERVVKEVENHFRTLPNSVEEFDHYKPAEFLMMQGSNLTLPALDEAVNRFEKLFEDLNKMLD